MARENLLGTDGFRNLATLESGPGKMNPETVGIMTASLIDVARAAGGGKNNLVFVAGDYRYSTPDLAAATLGAVHQRDAEPIWCGVNATPVTQWLAGHEDALATVVITASHNPVEYNGWKGMIGNRKPSPEQAGKISQRYWDLVEQGYKVNPDTSLKPSMELENTYVEALIGKIEGEFGRHSLKGKLLVYDGSFGAAKSITPKVLRLLGAQVEEFACGTGVINKGVGAADLSGLMRFLGAHPRIVNNPNFLGAFANDGDGDRLLAVGKLASGELKVINGNHAMYAMAQGQPGIVGTFYTNSGLREQLAGQGIGFEECDNGDTYVTERLLQLQAQGKDWTRGGEFTGHDVMTDWLTSGDGVHMAAWLAAWAVQNGKTFGDVYEDLSLWPEAQKNIKLSKEQMAQAKAKLNMEELSAHYSQRLSDYGRFIIRLSGTESMLRVWAEDRAGALLHPAIATAGSEIMQVIN